jgi:hypothetical protein
MNAMDVDNADVSSSVQDEIIDAVEAVDDELVIRLKAKIEEENSNLFRCREVISMLKENEQLILSAKKNYQASLSAYNRATGR